MNTTPQPTPATSSEAAWRRWEPQLATIAQTVARGCSRAPASDVDAHARLIILDTLGCALAGRGAPEVAAFERQAAEREPGGFALPGGSGLGLRPASQVLATGATWHEACEGHAFAHGRPGVATMAALLPLACSRGASLADTVAAFVLGYEVGARAGGWLRLNPGLHVDGNWPGLGVAAGVGRLLGLDRDRILTAVSIAACQLPYSLYLPIRTGRSVRNAYLAHSATLGLDAAFAAQAGFDAPPDALAYYAEHYCRAATTPLPPASTDLLLDAYLKPFAAVRHVHYGALAARRIRARLGDETRRIDRIALSIYEEATVYCSNPRPATALAAQFSLSFGVAAMLRHGGIDAASYASPAFDDPELRRLEALVSVSVDPDLTRAGRRGARVSVGTRQAGSAAADTWSETVAEDDPALSLDAAGVTAKFVRQAAGTVAPDVAAAFCAALIGDGGATPLRDLLARLGSPAG